MISSSNAAFELTFLDLDQELSALDWSKQFLPPPESVVERITEIALYEYSLRAVGDLAVKGIGIPLLDLSSTLLGGVPPARDNNYRV